VQMGSVNCREFVSVGLGPISERKKTFLDAVARFSPNAEAQVIAWARG
jgi:hypothetical protein